MGLGRVAFTHTDLKRRLSTIERCVLLFLLTSNSTLLVFYENLLFPDEFTYIVGAC